MTSPPPASPTGPTRHPGGIGRALRRGWWRLPAGLALLAALAWALRRAGDVVADAASVAAGVDRRALLAMAVVFLAERVLRAATVRASLPASSLSQGAMLNEVGAATSGGIPGGGAVGAGLRVAMARSWGHEPAPAWLSIAAANEAFGIAARTLALVVLAPELVARTADLVDVALAVVLAGSTVATVGTWVLLSRDTRLLRWWRRTATRLHGAVARFVPVRAFRSFEPATWIDRFREASAVLVARPARLFGPALAGHALGGLLFLLALRAVGVDLDAVDALRIHFLGKVAAGFAPTPGGIGVVEAGLTAALVAAGVPEVDALAAVLLTRGFSYAVPIGLGAGALGWWRVRHRGVREVGAGATVAASPLAVAADRA